MQTILEHKNGLVLPDTCVPVSGLKVHCFSLLGPDNKQLFLKQNIYSIVKEELRRIFYLCFKAWSLFCMFYFKEDIYKANVETLMPCDVYSIPW